VGRPTRQGNVTVRGMWISFLYTLYKMVKSLLTCHCEEQSGCESKPKQTRSPAYGGVHKSQGSWTKLREKRFLATLGTGSAISKFNVTAQLATKAPRPACLACARAMAGRHKG